MNKIIVVFIITMWFSGIKEFQIENGKYIYVEVFSDVDFKVKHHLNDSAVLLHKNGKYDFEEIENGLYRINKGKELKHLQLQINGELFDFDMCRYRKKKFFHLKVYYVGNEASGYLKKVLIGDYVRIINHCKSVDCNILQLELPYIVHVNDSMLLEGHSIFNDYMGE